MPEPTMHIAINEDPTTQDHRPVAKWKCDGCNISGEVPLRKHWDTWGVMTDIGNQHKQKSPKCDSIEQYPNETQAS